MAYRLGVNLGPEDYAGVATVARALRMSKSSVIRACVRQQLPQWLALLDDPAEAAATLLTDSPECQQD